MPARPTSGAVLLRQALKKRFFKLNVRTKNETLCAACVASASLSVVSLLAQAIGGHLGVENAALVDAGKCKL